MDYLAFKDELLTRPGSKVMMVEGTCRVGKNQPTKNGQVPEIRPKIANDPM